jgi:superfamily II DNA or RNA helicase
LVKAAKAWRLLSRGRRRSGKTIVAARITKKFYYHNGFPNHRSRILVIVSPGMKDTWRAELERFGIDDSARVLNNGSLHKIKPSDAEKFDLIIVDEAHKFRNDTAGGYTLLQKLCKTRTRHRLPDGSFAAKRVILPTTSCGVAGRKQ